MVHRNEANGAHTLRVLLLPRTGERYRLAAPELAERLEEPANPPGAPGEGGEEGTGGRVRRAASATWRWLKHRGGETERVLRELREIEGVELWYPAAMGERRARHLYRTLVEEAVERHRRWLWVDGALLPLSAVLSLVPGPNLLFAYLAWRTLGHWRSGRGGRRALSGLEVAFVPVPGLDPLLDLARRRFVLRRKARVREVGERLGVEGLEEVV